MNSYKYITLVRKLWLICNLISRTSWIVSKVWCLSA